MPAQIWLLSQILSELTNFKTHPEYINFNSKVLSDIQAHEMELITRKKNKCIRDREDKMTGYYRPWVRRTMNNNSQLSSKSSVNIAHTPGLSNQDNQFSAPDHPRQPPYSKQNPRFRYNPQSFRKKCTVF